MSLEEFLNEHLKASAHISWVSLSRLTCFRVDEVDTKVNEEHSLHDILSIDDEDNEDNKEGKNMGSKK